jgi:methyl-accepting chemotaxis protein
VRGAAERLETASSALNGAADAVSEQASSAEERVGAASMNVASAASSAEELATSIGEIAGQAATSTEVASRAVTEAQRTVQTMSQLATAATRIGEVIGLIQAIAGQTNLLALNATIERRAPARRAAASRWSRPSEKSRRPDREGDRRGCHPDRRDPSAAGDATEAIEQVNNIIGEMSGIAARVAAAVEEQNAPCRPSRKASIAPRPEARSGAEAMTRVARRERRCALEPPTR